MKSKLQFAAVFFSCIFTFSCSYIQKTMPIETGNFRIEDYTKKRDYSGSINRIKKNSNYDFNIFGSVSYKESTYDLYEFVINNNREKDLLLFSGVHGNEPGGVFALMEFIKNMDDQSDIFSKYNIHIVPIVNPWGWEFNSRFNGRGIDINRDFANMDTLSDEAGYILSYFKDMKAEIVLDFHESYSKGHYFYVYNPYMKKIVKKFISENWDNYTIENGHKVSFLEVENGIIYSNKFIIGLIIWADRAALANNFLSMSKAVLTIESSRNHDMDNRIAFHLDALNFIVSEVESK